MKREIHVVLDDQEREKLNNLIELETNRSLRKTTVSDYIRLLIAKAYEAEKKSS